MKQFVTLLLVCFALMQAQAQQKLEKEYVISENNVPTKAVTWLKDATASTSVKKLKWYAEKSGDKLSYEAKFKSNRQLFSVEFSAEGNIEDIEILTPCSDLPQSFYNSLESYLAENYRKYKVIKVQQQLVGESSKLQDYFTNQSTEQLTVNYEVEHYGKSRTENAEFEVLFAEDGEVLRKREIIYSPSTNVVY